MFVSKTSPQKTAEQSEKWKNKVLWVDDRPENNVYERKAFESQGIEFSLAQSTNEAMENLKNNKYAAIISDMGRKEGSQEGYVLLEKLRKSGKQTPYFIYACSNSHEHKMMALERGAQGSTNSAQELYEMVMNRIAN
ncbi:response regulator [Marivirga salinae]|uniref:Response regulator n=1 Tax=Marivirga salinarum TaxID=3059078 RepID=A0AA51N8I3_9BACT|nr:response regulator [Marivirga sp. BDSF4-3]WMN10732.1 response regulator [Marivirga sp. BDSF4-3]